MGKGHVWIVGAGPGDPGLLTVAGAAALARAEVVFYDALSSPALLRGVPAEAELVYVGKRAGHHAMAQSEMNTLLVDRAQRGKRVVRLKGGDPFVFGRGSEEALACRAVGTPFTIIPGVSSALAAPAYAGIPVTHRGLAANFMVIAGNDAGTNHSATEWEAAALADTLVILMGASTLADNMARLHEAGKPSDTPVACIRWGTRPDQRVLCGTTGTIAALAAEAGLESPVVTVVGPVAALAEQIAWFEPGPLAGKSIVVTRARTQSSSLATRFEALGAHVVEAPAIRVRPLPENFTNTELDTAHWDWMVFNSQNGVESFFSALRQSGHDTRALARTSVACVGEATAAALHSNGVLPDFQPSRATAAALADEWPGAWGARILLPLSSLADGQLAGALEKRGGHVHQVVAYETLPEPLGEERLREVLSADAITFTSASTAMNLLAALGEAHLPGSARLVSIGAQTSAAVRECFGRVDRQAGEASLDALVAATREALAWE